MESIFTFLFKYRPILFEEGQIVFATPWPLAALLGVAVLVAIAAVVTYGTTGGGRATPRDRTIMATLRVAALGVLVFALMQPTLVLESTVPQRNFVGILLDDSRSMTLPGENGAPRGDLLRERFGPDGSELVDELGERFTLRYFRFASETSRVPDAGGLGFMGTRTDLAGALDRARQELSSVPLSGLVVLSDGADNGGRALAESLVPLQAASIPVYTVGVGAEALTPDLQIGRIEVPRTVLQGSTLLVDVVVTHRGYRGRTVELVVEDGNRRIAQEPVELDGEDEPAIVPVRITLEEPGPRRLRFRLPGEEDEAVLRNNTREVLVEVRPEVEKILYFEGEPRHEVGFTRRAIEDDDNLQLVVLQRTAEGKFMRLAVDDADELAGGFPRTREELFRYRGLVIGSVEASFFTQDQLSMIADFASRRGGGVLFLGGRLSYAEGDYAGTAIEDALPVFLEEPQDPRGSFVELRVSPTAAGRAHPISRILPREGTPAPQASPGASSEGSTPAGAAETPTDLEAAWATLPPIGTMNRIVRAKPGATTLLTGATPDGEERIVLAHHRYGRGKVIALPVKDTWIWQMHADIPVEDPRHELLWQQLLRWLVDGVPERVSVEPDRERVESGEPVRLTATALDSAHLELNSVQVTATVSAPSGEVFVQPLPWSVEEDGIYQGAFTPAENGLHTVEVVAVQAGDTIGRGTTFFQTGPSDEEYFDANRRTRLLERLAEDTNGRYYTPETLHRLPEDLRFTGAGVTLTEERDLRDMPLLFLLLVGLLGAEWGYRRMRGMA